MARCFCWDFFTLRWARFRPAPNDNRMFAARKLGAAAARTYGRLHRNDDGSMVFSFRPWLIRPVRSVPVPADLAVGHGVFYSTMLTRTADGEITRFLLPPRYRGHESELARACGDCAIVDVGLRRGWKWLKETLGFGPAPEEPAAVPATAAP